MRSRNLVFLLFSVYFCTLCFTFVFSSSSSVLSVLFIHIFTSFRNFLRSIFKSQLFFSIFIFASFLLFLSLISFQFATLLLPFSFQYFSNTFTPFLLYDTIFSIPRANLVKVGTNNNKFCQFNYDEEEDIEIAVNRRFLSLAYRVCCWKLLSLALTIILTAQMLNCERRQQAIKTERTARLCRTAVRSAKRATTAQEGAM